MARNFKQ